MTEPKKFDAPGIDLQRIRCLYTSEGVLLYDAANDRAYEGNRLAREVLQLLNGQRDILSISQCIADRYQIPPEIAQQDVGNLLERLLEYHLLETG